MSVPVRLLIALIALLHLYFMWLEMFAWTSRGKKVFKNFPAELFEPTKKLAANQGLYNGFLSAGLIWALIIGQWPWNLYVAVFFLCCVLVAGIYGAVTVHRKIFFIQGLPALSALLMLHMP
jgi:putative membrane protein